MMGLNLNGTDIAIETRDERRETRDERRETRDEEGCLLNPQDWTP